MFSLTPSYIIPFCVAFILAAWAIYMDKLIGLIYLLLSLSYLYFAHHLQPTTVIMPLVCALISLSAEALSHLLIQGHLPGGPPEHKDIPSLSKSQSIIFVPYFVIMLGPFFLTLDLAMRFFDFRPYLNKSVNNITYNWHEIAAEQAKEEKTREWHLRVIKMQQNNNK